MNLIKKTVKVLLGIDDFDRRAEYLVKKSIYYYSKNNKFYKILAMRLYYKIRKKYNCDIFPGVKFGKNIYIAHPNNILIGKTAVIGSNCKIYPNSYIIASVVKDDGKFVNNVRRHAIIGNNCLIGSGCIIIGDIKIGNNCIIAAGAIVTKNIPNNSIVYGVNMVKENKYEKI